jgi:hypothetical protein
MSRYRHLLELPPDDAWPPPEELLDRKALARLFKVPRETIRNWERAGFLPDRVPPPPGHVIEKGVTYIFYRSADVREWAQKESRIFRILPPIKPNFPPDRFAARPPVDVDAKKPTPAATIQLKPPPAKRPRPRAPKVPPSQLVYLSRNEAALNQLGRASAEFVEPVEPAIAEGPVTSGWHALEEGEPAFVDNTRRSRGPRRYW